MIRPIIKGPNSLLTTVSERFDIGNPNHMTVIGDLADTIVDTPRAVGLAAVQIGVPIRVFVMRMDDEIHGFINPVVNWASAINAIMEEECMSYPWLSGVKVARPGSITLMHHTRAGDEIVTSFSGLQARVALHEIDHLNGITIDTIRRMK